MWKSTILKLIAKLEKVDGGNISIKKDAKVAYLDQAVSDKKYYRNVKEILLEVFEELNELIRKTKK